MCSALWASSSSAFEKKRSQRHSWCPKLLDLMVYSKTLPDPDQNLDTLLCKLKETGLVLNENEFHFRKPCLRFLWHVTADGILPDQEHINAVQKALLSLLQHWFVSWFSKFLPHFATVKPIAFVVHLLALSANTLLLKNRHLLVYRPQINVEKHVPLYTA